VNYPLSAISAALRFKNALRAALSPVQNPVCNGPLTQCRMSGPTRHPLPGPTAIPTSSAIAWPRDLRHAIMALGLTHR